MSLLDTIELAGLLTQKLGRTGSVADWFQNFDTNPASFVLVAMFVGTWVVALAVWRLAIEEKWSLGME